MMYKIKEAILGLPKNKTYKKEKITGVDIIFDSDNECQFVIGTRFAEFLVGFGLNEDDTIYGYGHLRSTSYCDIDDLLYASMEQCCIGEWHLDFETQDVSLIIDEVINQMNQENLKTKYEFLWKAYKTIKKFADESEDNETLNLFKEMIHTYSMVNFI